MYAIETKKRKFDRVFESLHQPTASTTSLASVDVGQQSKPAGLDQDAKSNASLSSKKLKLSGELPGTPSRSVQTRSISPSASKPRPNYLPFDRAAFLERLLTFRDLTKWKTGKPDAINEVRWAKRGWSCVGVDRVACVGGCNKQLVVRLAKQETQSERTDNRENSEGEERQAIIDLPDAIDGEGVHVNRREDSHAAPERPEEASDLEDLELSSEKVEARNALVERYKQLISTGHDDRCPWRRRGCDASIHRIPLTNASTSIAHLQSRYESLEKIESEIPSEIYITEDLSVPGLQQALESQYEDGIFVDAAGQQYSPKNICAFALALCGWEGEATPVPLAECKACFRRLGLWTYRPARAGGQSIMENLHAVDEHLDYCPWKNGEAQAGGSIRKLPSMQDETPRPGWSILYQLVLKNGERHTKRKVGGSGSDVDHFSPDQSENRDSKTRELVKKVRDLTRGFKVKGLIRKKRP